MSKGKRKAGTKWLSPDAVASELERLMSLDATELRTIWPEHFGPPAPARMRRDLLARVLAHQVQVGAFGGLSKAAERRLDEVAADEFGETVKRSSFAARNHLSTGTRLLREWRGIVHEVCVTDAGFLWQGNAYRSLSAVARAITGTRWNGPAFFGLRTSGGS